MAIKRSFTVNPVPSHLEKWGARAPPSVPAGFGATAGPCFLVLKIKRMPTSDCLCDTVAQLLLI